MFLNSPNLRVAVAQLIYMRNKPSYIHLFQYRLANVRIILLFQIYNKFLQLERPKRNDTYAFFINIRIPLCILAPYKFGVIF